MSAIVEIQERIQSTVARIAEYEKAALLPGAPASLAIGIRSLEKLKAELEQDFAKLARDEELEVCKYRLLPQQGIRPSITAIANAWTRYQSLFSSVYEALLKQRSGKRKVSTRQARTETQFAFAYTFTGSIGVVLTLPTEQMTYFRARDLEQVNKVIFDMTRAGSAEKLASFVETLGVPPVVKFAHWVDAHVAFAAGAGIEWEMSREGGPLKLLVQTQEFKALKDAMDQITEPKEETLPVTGILTMADMDKRTFRMKLDSGERITGTFVDAISEEQRAELPRRYEALVRTTTEIQPAIEKLNVTRFLVRLGRQLQI